MDGALRNRTTAGDLMLAQPEEWSRRTSFNLRMVSLFCGNWESPLLSGVQPPPLPCAPFQSHADHRSNMNRKTDRLQFGMLIGITSES